MGDMVLFLVAVALVVLIIYSLIQRARGKVPMPSPQPPTLRLLTGHVLRNVDGWIEWKHPYGQGLRVPVEAIAYVTVERTKWAKANLKVIGAGAELAQVKDLAEPEAVKAQEWISSQVKDRKPAPSA